MELTQKGEVVSRLQAKAGQIGKILNNLEKYNHLLKDEKKQYDRRSNEKRQKIQVMYREKQVKIDDKPPNRSEEVTKDEVNDREPSTSESIDSFVNLELDTKIEEHDEVKIP